MLDHRPRKSDRPWPVATALPKLKALIVLASRGPASDRDVKEHQVRGLTATPVAVVDGSVVSTIRVPAWTDRDQQT